MAGERRDIIDARLAPSSEAGQPSRSLERVADQLGVLRRAVADRAVHPDLRLELRRNAEGAHLVLVDTRTNTEALLVGPTDWMPGGTYGSP